MIVFCYTFVCVSYLVICFSCQYLPSDWLERLLWWHLYVVRRLSPQNPGGNDCVYFFFCLICLYCYVSPPPPSPTQYIFHTPTARHSLFVPKVLLNTNKPHQTSGDNELIYTVFRKKTTPYLIAHNFGKCWPIFEIFHPHTQQRSYNELIIKGPTVYCLLFAVTHAPFHVSSAEAYSWPSARDRRDREVN